MEIDISNYRNVQDLLIALMATGGQRTTIQHRDLKMAECLYFNYRELKS